MATETFTTARLILRPLVANDVDALWCTLGRADVMEHYVDLSDHSSGWTHEQVATFIESCVSAWQHDKMGRWGLVHRATNELIGYCGLSRMAYLPELDGLPELDVSIHPDYWGQGLAREAATFARDWIFRHGVVSMIACHVPAHTRSASLVKNLGLNYERTCGYHSPISGRTSDFLVYRITRNSWMSIVGAGDKVT